MSANSRRGRPPHADLLTPAEWRTVHALQHGLSNRDIARRRGISTDAVKFHIANALAKLALPDRRALRRWFRAPAGSALARSNRVMSELQLGPVAQISRGVRDLNEAQAFYGQTLGLRHLYTFGTAAFYDLAGTRLYLQQQEHPAAESILYLRVGDIRAAFEQLSARGVQFAGAPHLIHRHADGTEEWLASFTDPEGRPLMLMSQVPP